MTIRLIVDIPERGLVIGDTGKVLGVVKQGSDAASFYEVAFSDRITQICFDECAVVPPK